MKTEGVPKSFKPAEFYRLGVAIYRMYLTIEEDGTQFRLHAEPDGRITSPEGMAELIERTLAVKLEQPGDQVRFHADPKHNVPEEDLAEGGSGGQTGQAEAQGAPRDEGEGPKRTRRAIPPD